MTEKKNLKFEKSYELSEEDKEKVQKVLEEGREKYKDIEGIVMVSDFEGIVMVSDFDAGPFFEHELEENQTFGGLQHKVVFKLGDYTRDGHGCHERFELKCNYPANVLRDMYKKAVAETEFNFQKEIMDKEQGLDLEKLQGYGLLPMEWGKLEAALPDSDVLDEEGEVYLGPKDYISLLLKFCNSYGASGFAETIRWEFVQENKSEVFNEPGMGFLGYGMYHP